MLRKQPGIALANQSYKPSKQYAVHKHVFNGSMTIEITFILDLFI